MMQIAPEPMRKDLFPVWNNISLCPIPMLTLRPYQSKLIDETREH